MYTYIIVDDETSIRKGTIKKLEPLHDIITCAGEAANGQEAIALAEETAPDIIITDMSMPVMDGTNLLPWLTEHFPSTRIIIISGYKEFEYMKHALSAKAVDYILKPFSRKILHEAVQKAIKGIEENAELENQASLNEEEKERACYEYDIQMLKNIILGYHSGTPVLTSRKLKSMNTTHNLVLITIHSLKIFEESMIQDFLDENGFGDLALYLQHLHNNYIGFFTLFIPQNSTLNYMAFCKQIMEGLSSLFSEKYSEVTFGISEMHSDLLQLHDAFNETVSALNRKQPNDTENYYFYTQLAKENLPIDWKKADELLFRMESGRKDEVTALLHDLFHYFHESNMPLSDIKYYCFRLSDRAKAIMAGYFDQLSTDNVSSSMQHILNSMFSLNELQQYYQQFFTNIAEMLKEKSVYNTGDTVEKMKIYIQRNCSKDLNTGYLSSLFYLNRSYCSHLFHKTTGLKLIDYINQVRIDKAKEILIETDKKTYQIAKAVGYDNVKYFFRVFKKAAGVSPVQYRDQMR